MAIKNTNNKEYYVNKKDEIMKQFNSLIKVAAKIDFPIHIESEFHLIEERARLELNELLPRLTYVGGDKSPFTSLMIQSAQTIALYKATKSLNLNEREIGKLIYEIAEKYAQSISSVKKWFYRRAIYSEKMKNYWREWLGESRTGKYPENWVGEFKEGDDENFEYGIDFNECGWLKLIQKEGAEEIAPYACLCDYARMQSIGVGFKRTKTLAAGAPFCDFRFGKQIHTQKGWPPENLEEYK